jgi:hypothetical protein
MTIDWKFPPPRRGLAGALDRFVGPGATTAELALQTVLPLLAAIAAVYHASRTVARWDWIEYAVCGALAFDVVGGIVTNATSSAKRWYHRAGQGVRQHLGFVSLHLLHLLVVSSLYLSFDLEWFAITGGYLLSASAIELAVSQYLQRPVALALYACALLVCLYLIRPPPGLEWFLPLFYLKLLVSHLPREEPYRPADATARAEGAKRP